MEENISRFVTSIIAIFILFVFPVYTAYEKKDDISYALAVRYTQDFVENVRKKGYITQELYQDYAAKLLTTGNTYKIELEHEYVRYDGDYVDKTVGTATRNTELFTNNHILNILNNGQIYTMNVNDNFNVKIKNTNVTLATVIYNIVTVNASNNNVRIYVDYGGKILAEKWYADNLLYSKYGGLVEIGGYKINVSIDNSVADEEEDVGIIEPTVPEDYLANKVKIGDYVEYYTDPTANSYTIMYAAKWYNGKKEYSDWENLVLYKNANISWRVLNIKDGSNVVLISEGNALSHTFDCIAYSEEYFSSYEKYNVLSPTSIINQLEMACNYLFSYKLGDVVIGTARNANYWDIRNAPADLRKTTGIYPVSESYEDWLYFYPASGDVATLKTREQSAILRPVVELSENAQINIDIGGCADTSRTCGTKDNPWLISMTQTNVTKLGDVADVGEFVNYIPDSNPDGTAKSITIPKEVSGKTAVTWVSGTGYVVTDDTFTQMDINWRVLANDGNKVTLISDDITNFTYFYDSDTVTPESYYSGGLHLGGNAGYNNAINIINNLCKELYSKTGVATARSVNESDLIKAGYIDNNNNNGYEVYTLKSGSYPSRLNSSSYVGTSISKAKAWSKKIIDNYIENNHTITLEEGNYKEIVRLNTSALSFVLSSDKTSNMDAKLLSGAAYGDYLIYDDRDRYYYNFGECNYYIPRIEIIGTGNNVSYTVRTVNGTSVGYGTNLYYSSHALLAGVRAVVELDADLLVNTEALSLYDGSSSGKAIQLIY